MVQCVLNCTVTCAGKWGENKATNTSFTFYRYWYKTFVTVSVPYYGTNSANRQKYPNNKPDSIIRDNKQGTFMSIDVAIRADRNVNKKVAEKILKYEYFTK